MNNFKKNMFEGCKNAVHENSFTYYALPHWDRIWHHYLFVLEYAHHPSGAGKCIIALANSTADFYAYTRA